MSWYCHERVVSLFNFLRTWESSDEIFNAEIRSFKDLNEFVLSGYWLKKQGPDFMFRPQSSWIYSSLTKKKKVDFIGKIESIDIDLAKIVQVLKLPIKPNIIFPKLNVSKKEFTESDLSEKAKEAIALKYRVDFLNFYADEL